MTTADLAAARQVRHQTMAATVKELTDAGLLAAGPDPDDARKKILTLTPSGTAAITEDRQRRVAVLAEALDAALDEAERRDLAHALDLIDRIARSAGRTGSTGSTRSTRSTRTGHPSTTAAEPLTGAW
jgi:DNA-binding MarR family transcriptional regulator